MLKGILLVDDETDYAVLLSRTLQDEGYTVTAVNSGTEAIYTFTQALKNKTPFSLILLDVRLPDISGIEVLKLVRQEEVDRGIPPAECVPVIVFTVYDDQRGDVAIIKGRNHFMIKSADNTELLKAIAERIPAD